jgi:hypothetical protein
VTGVEQLTNQHAAQEPRRARHEVPHRHAVGRELAAVTVMCTPSFPPVDSPSATEDQSRSSPCSIANIAAAARVDAPIFP